MSLGARSWFALALGVLAPLSCSSDDDRRAPPASSGTRNTGRAGSGGDTDTAAGGEGLGGSSSGGDAGAGNVGQLDLGGSLSIAGAPSYDPPLCDIKGSWGNATPLPGINSELADERLLGMTHDELTLVFTRDDVLLVADRSAVDDDFGAPAPVALPEGYTHLHGVALHPDGLGLVVVSEPGVGGAPSYGGRLADVTRGARSGSFDGQPDSARFDAIADNSLQHGGALSSPVLSASGTSLYFTELGGGTSEVFRTQGTTTFAVPGMPEDLVTLGGSDGVLKLTLSVSADERTIFIFDEELGHVVGLWSSAPGAPFYDPADFAGLESVFTDSSCRRLYGTRLVNGSLDVVLETAE